MREALEKILAKVVLPTNDRLSCVQVSQMGMGEIYIITYYINDRIDYKDGYEIESETRNMFNMLGFDKGENFIVQFRTEEELDSSIYRDGRLTCYGKKFRKGN